MPKNKIKAAPYPLLPKGTEIRDRNSNELYGVVKIDIPPNTIMDSDFKWTEAGSGGRNDLRVVDAIRRAVELYRDELFRLGKWLPLTAAHKG